ncbi:MAG: hypothetical protein F4Y99_11730, partial [Acidimicrobiaceae bacterium]|nr:hypothetical protein [Acidimicrobiaceae bacterium]MYF42627.1 hypothetical protein [Acidimicrobiaceae bacterium]
MTISIPRKSVLALAAVALLAATAALVPAAGAQTPVPISADTFSLTILHNNDGESKLLPDEDAGFPG